nr:MAG TPA: hypothetical protein [Caudoviricetes sp.]
MGWSHWLFPLSPELLAWAIFAAQAKKKQKQISSAPKITQLQRSQQQNAG